MTSITPLDEYEVNVNISANVADGTIYYLRGEFFKPSTTNYCGFTWNGSSWFNGPFTSQGWLNLLPITISSDSWTGVLKAKFDQGSSACLLAGNYNFRVLRYTAGGSSSTDGQTPLSLIVSFATPTAIPLPSPTPESTLTPTNSPSPSPTSAVSPSPSATPTSTPAPSPIPTEVEATPTPSPSPSPTLTPTPTPKERNENKHQFHIHVPKLVWYVRFERRGFGRFMVLIPHFYCRFE